MRRDDFTVNVKDGTNAKCRATVTVSTTARRVGEPDGGTGGLRTLPPRDSFPSVTSG